jgi:flagellar FliL protein
MAQEAPKGKSAAAPAAAGAEAAPAASGGGGWLPVIVVLIAVPLLSFAMAEFVLFPRLEKRLAANGVVPPAGEEKPAAKPAASGHGHGKAEGEHGGEGSAAQSYEFKDIVSNLAGEMKSRYIKVAFTAYGSDPKFTETIEANKAKLLDTTLGVLGSLNLAEMEDSSIKNKVRSSLVQAYHTVLHARIIEEVYFSEFVIQ